MQKVVPAILTKDPSELQRQLRVLKDQIHWVHIDIMDGKFVPATSISISELGEAYQFFNLEIHLMVENPERYFEDCKAIGAKRVIFHMESTVDMEKVLEEGGKYEFKKSIALNPKTPVDALLPFFEKIDSIVLMSIVPGAQGQEFISRVFEKIHEAKTIHPDIILSIDGGVGEENIQDLFKAGCDYVAVGSGIWKTEDPVASLRELQEMVS